MGRRKVTARQCEAYSCSEPLPPGSRADRRWCSERCRTRMARARGRARERLVDGTPPTLTDEVLAAHDHVDLTTPHPNATTPGAIHLVGTTLTPAELAAGTIPATLGGEGFQRFVATRVPDRIDRAATTRTAAARTLGVSNATMTAWMDLYHALTATRRAATDWHDDPAAQHMRDYALSSFRAFNEVFFPDILVPGFHEEWDEEFTTALDDGERTMLIAPQRHGKSEFSIRQVLYRIARDPDICIGWVGKTADLARKAVAVVRQYLENDPQFAAVLLPPDTGFKPPTRRGVPWTNDEFTVATRTRIRKSPTMVALGIGGTILGRDFDLIVIDDPIDRALCLSPTERENVKEWFLTDFNSRIEEDTGVIYVGSRQHKDDLPGTITANNEARVAAGHEPDWRILVYRAHDPGCPHDLDTHPPEVTDCLLWPDKRSAPWLAEQQRNNPEHFERNYQANPLGTLHRPVRPDDMVTSFATDAHLSRNLWGLDHPRRLGDPPPGGWTLVASVDPAVAKRNAAVLLAIPPGGTVPLPVAPIPPDLDDGVHRSHHNPSSPLPSSPPPELADRPVHAIAVVDFDEPDPGSPGVVDLLNRWYEQYRVTTWVFETNLFADQIANDTHINDFRSRNGLRFHTHWTTQHNKHSPQAGVLAMLSSMRGRPCPLLLPGTSPDSARRLERLVRQMLEYDPEATHTSAGRRSSRIDDDLVMAMWFGWYWASQHTGRSSGTILRTYDDTFGSFAPSGWTIPPWEDIA